MVSSRSHFRLYICIYLALPFPFLLIFPLISISSYLSPYREMDLYLSYLIISISLSLSISFPLPIAISQFLSTFIPLFLTVLFSHFLSFTPNLFRSLLLFSIFDYVPISFYLSVSLFRSSSLPLVLRHKLCPFQLLSLQKDSSLCPVSPSLPVSPPASRLSLATYESLTNFCPTPFVTYIRKRYFRS